MAGSIYTDESGPRILGGQLVRSEKSGAVGSLESLSVEEAKRSNPKPPPHTYEIKAASSGRALRRGLSSPQRGSGGTLSRYLEALRVVPRLPKTSTWKNQPTTDTRPDATRRLPWGSSTIWLGQSLPCALTSQLLLYRIKTHARAPPKAKNTNHRPPLTCPNVHISPHTHTQNSSIGTTWTTRPPSPTKSK